MSLECSDWMAVVYWLCGVIFGAMAIDATHTRARRKREHQPKEPTP